MSVPPEAVSMLYLGVEVGWGMKSQTSGSYLMGDHLVDAEGPLKK